MSKIIDIYGIEILNSRGIPTTEVHIKTEKVKTYSSCPSGKSKSKKEAVDIRDGNPKRYFGKGVLKAVNIINTKIKREVLGKDVGEYKEIEERLLNLDDEKKSKFGMNSLLPTIISILKAYSLENDKYLYEVFNEYYFKLFNKRERYRFPTPMANLINGGLHSNSYLDFQEYMVVPIGIKELDEKIRAIVEIFHKLKENIKNIYGKESCNYGDEGGYVLLEKDNSKPIELLLKTIEELGYNNEVKISLDIAASSFYKDGYYYINGNKLTKLEYLEYLEENIIKPYESYLYSIEDPFYEDDFELFSYLNKKYKIKVVGDDLTSTNPKYLKKAINFNSVNGVIVKPNQIGSIKETLEFIKLAKENNIFIIPSHRSGETCDVFIIHLAIGLGSKLVKIGAPNRGERVEKYNELLRLYIRKN